MRVKKLRLIRRQFRPYAVNYEMEFDDTRWSDFFTVTSSYFDDLYDSVPDEEADVLDVSVTVAPGAQAAGWLRFSRDPSLWASTVGDDATFGFLTDTGQRVKFCQSGLEHVFGVDAIPETFWAKVAPAAVQS